MTTAVRIGPLRIPRLPVAVDAALVGAAVLVVLAWAGGPLIATQAAVLACSGYLAGLLNTAAGSGGLVSLLAVMATGVPAHAAAVANQAATPASFAPARKRMLAGSGAGSATPAMIAAMIAATVAGSVVLAFMPPATFAAVAPAVIAAAVVLLLLQPYSPALLRRLHRRHLDRACRRLQRDRNLPVLTVELPAARWTRLRMPLALLACGLYAGLVGAGVGTLTVMILAYFMNGSLADAAQVRNKLCLFAATAAGGTVLTLTILAGYPVAWLAALVMAPAMYVGGAHGVRLVEVLRPYDFWLRILIAATSMGMATWLIVN